MKNNYEIKDSVVDIYLNRRDGSILKTIIDADDFEHVNSMPYTWYAYYSKFTDSFYAVSNFMREDGSQTMIYLHRWIMKPQKDMFIDHIDYDTLNNTKRNLREVTVSESSSHRRREKKGNKNSTTGIKYIYIQHGKYAVIIREDRKNKCIGRFDDLEDAKKCLNNYYENKKAI